MFPSHRFSVQLSLFSLALCLFVSGCNEAVPPTDPRLYQGRLPDIRVKVSDRSINSLAIAPGENGIAVSASDGWIYFLSNDLKIIREVSIGPSAGAMTFTPDGKKLMAVMEDDTKEDEHGQNRIFEIEVIDTDTGKVIQHMGRSTGYSLDEIACSHSGRFLAIRGDPLRIFDIETGVETGRWDWFANSPVAGAGLVFSGDDQLLYCGGAILPVSADGKFDTRHVGNLSIGGNLTTVTPEGEHWLSVLDWNPRFMGTGYQAAKLFKGDVAGGACKATWILKYPESDKNFVAIQASHHGQVLLTELMGDVVIHNANDGGIEEVLKGNVTLQAAAFSADEHSVYGIDFGGFVCQWRLQDPPH